MHIYFHQTGTRTCAVSARDTAWGCSHLFTTTRCCCLSPPTHLLPLRHTHDMMHLLEERRSRTLPLTRRPKACFRLTQVISACHEPGSNIEVTCMVDAGREYVGHSTTTTLPHLTAWTYDGDRGGRSGYDMRIGIFIKEKWSRFSATSLSFFRPLSVDLCCWYWHGRHTIYVSQLQQTDTTLQSRRFWGHPLKSRSTGSGNHK